MENKSGDKGVTEIGEWRKISLDSYDEIIKTMNGLKLKRSDIIHFDRDEKTGKITMIYFW